MDRATRRIIEELFREWKLVTEAEIRRLDWGFTRPDMARSIESWCDEGAGMNDECLRDCERRRRNPTGRLTIALCKRFGVSSVDLLGLGRAKETARWWTWMTLDEKDYLVNRRTMLKGGAAGLMLIPASDLVYYAQVIGRRKGHTVSDGDVNSAQATATDLAIAYNTNPDADTRRAARAHALTILDLLKPSHATMDPTTRNRLQAVASDGCALTGVGDLTAGRFADADRWFRCALGLAREARDRRLEALTHAALAYLSTELIEPNHARAVIDLEAAAELAAFLPPSARAFVYGFLAEQHAELGEDLVSGRFLEQVRAATSVVRYEEPGWGWWSTHAHLSGWDGGRPDHFAGTRALSLGRPAQALELLDNALAGVTVPTRRTQLHIDRMKSSVALGDADRACASTHAALDLVHAHALATGPAIIRKACSAFPTAWTRRGDVRELHERLRAAA